MDMNMLRKTKALSALAGSDDQKQFMCLEFWFVLSLLLLLGLLVTLANGMELAQ